MNNVTSIAENAFYGCSAMSTLVIPNKIVSIGNSAFSGCSGVTSITIPNNVTTVWNYAFSGTSITEITIPKSITGGNTGNYEHGPFSGCSLLTKVIFEEGTTSIYNSILSDARSVTEVIIPDSVTNISRHAFYNCTSLTTVNFLGTRAQWEIVTIGSNNTPLTSATITCSDD